jgi:transposase
MLYHAKPEKVFYYGRPVDFRKQAMGLAALVDTELPGELKAGHWFVFISSDKKKAKILYWRGTGLALWQLRLERDLFKLGHPRSVSTHTLSWRDLGRLLDGLNIFSGEAHEVTKAKRFS